MGDLILLLALIQLGAMDAITAAVVGGGGGRWAVFDLSIGSKSEPSDLRRCRQVGQTRGRSCRREADRLIGPLVLLALAAGTAVEAGLAVKKSLVAE